MRFKAIRLAWFRGAADSISLEASCKSLVVYGPNGTGKSSFVDAIEHALSKGRIRHLAHEYSGRHQEKGICNTHTPANRTTDFSITLCDDSALDVTIARSGTSTRSGSAAVAIDSWDYRRTVLRQDEVSNFIHSRKGEKYSALLPLFGLHELEIAAENLRQLRKSVEQQSNLAQDQETLDQVEFLRLRVFGIDDDATIEAKITAQHIACCSNSETADHSTRCQELLQALSARMNDLSAANRRYLSLESICALDVAAGVAVVRSANAQLADSVEPLIAEKLGALQSADAFAARLDAGGDVECPACGQSIAVDQFKAHIRDEKERLRELIRVYGERRAAIGSLLEGLRSIQNKFAATELGEWRDALDKEEFHTNLAWLDSCDVEALRQSIVDDDLQAIDGNCSPLIEAAREATECGPPDVKTLVKQREDVEAAIRVFESKAVAERVSEIKRLVAFIGASEDGVREEIRERSEAVIAEISDDIGTMWEELNPGVPITNVRLYLPADDKAIDIALRFHGKDQDSPRLTLSEGYRNSLGICIFLAMANRDREEDRPLLLDDVVISLDRNYRGMIAELLEKRFSDRQVIVLTHDRDWYTELRMQLDERRWAFKTLMPYESPTVGIRWSHKTTTFGDARSQLQGRPDSAGNDARKIMDVDLAAIAEKLQIRFPYLRGDKNDRRMSNDFLERLIADGRRCFERKVGSDYQVYETALDALDSARRLLGSWANKASHSFDVVRPEAVKLIDTCEKALEVFRCITCKKPVWYADVSNAESVQCHCGELRWRYGKG